MNRDWSDDYEPPTDYRAHDLRDELADEELVAWHRRYGVAWGGAR